MEASTTSAGRPRVVILCDRTVFAGHPAHQCLHGYVQALSQVADATPLLLPAELAAQDLAGLVDAHDGIDGVLLPGSPTNVAAERYGMPPLPATAAVDPARDSTALALLPALVEAGVPLLGICRGFQELNVACGGTLDAAVHERPGRMDHREGSHDRPIADWYEDRHPVHLAHDGLLARLVGTTQAMVNSLHHQGVDRLGKGLRVEATAPDGLVEAFTVEAAPALALGVQWHPEMRVADSLLARRIFEAFGQACRHRRQARLERRGTTVERATQALPQ